MFGWLRKSPAAQIFAPAEHCPLGCYCAVFVKRVTDGQVFVFCNTCGLAWDEAENETWELGDYGAADFWPAITDGSALEFATVQDIEQAGLSDMIAKEMPLDDFWREALARFNDKNGVDREPIR